MRFAGIGLAIATLLAACTSFSHGYNLHRFQGQVLSAKAGTGAEALEIQRDLDSEVRDYCAQNGLPDYILVEDQFATKLVYVESDRVVRFQRSWTEAVGTRAVTEGIPEALLRLLPANDQKHLAAKRAGASSGVGAAPSP